MEKLSEHFYIIHSLIYSEYEKDNFKLSGAYLRDTREPITSERGIVNGIFSFGGKVLYEGYTYKVSDV